MYQCIFLKMEAAGSLKTWCYTQKSELIMSFVISQFSASQFIKMKGTLGFIFVFIFH
jgi:hypothetical protein